MMNLSPIIEMDELFNVYQNPDVLIFDASNGPNAYHDFLAHHLQNAFFIDVNTHLADAKENVSIGGRHPLPQPDKFSATLTNLGISINHHVIIYDNYQCANAAARFWWMLKAAGHQKVQVLNGGLAHAIRNQFHIQSGTEVKYQSNTPYSFSSWSLPQADMNEVEKSMNNPSKIIIDVRDSSRFRGEQEPIDLIAGHIPGAINLPYKENLDAEGLFLAPSVLKQKYSPIISKVGPENTIIHCGSGITACHTLLALEYAQLPLPKIYVGSWSEWSRNDKAVALSLDDK